MLAQFRHSSRTRRAAALLALLPFIAFAPACDKVPLLAPGGTVITMFPTSTTVALNGEIEIVATAIENGTATTPPTNGGGTPPANGGTPTTPTTTSTTGAGTPVHNGTVITFTTTIGRIEPAEARTNNGQVRVRFIAGGQSGTATVTAFSGGASAKLENLRVGSAAVERVLLTATPQTLGPTGGTAVISARVEDVSGAGVPGVPVTFTATVGTLSSGSVTTDAAGVANVNMTTTRQTTVTANVAGKTATVALTLNPRTGVSITPPSTTIFALLPSTFTVGVAAGGEAGPNIRDVNISWGDGSSQSLGALSTTTTTVTHTYQEAGQFTITATAMDASGFSESVSTSVNVLPAQPPTVLVQATPSTAGVNVNVVLRAQVQNTTSTAIRYEWNFGSDAIPQTATTSGPQASARWTLPGNKFPSVTVIFAAGPTGDGFGSVLITSAAAATSEQKK